MNLQFCGKKGLVKITLVAQTYASQVNKKIHIEFQDGDSWNSGEVSWLLKEKFLPFRKIKAAKMDLF